ncbi:hypothetical protein C2G38_169858 [Gigaspora rosea]|uniref:Uncharacterized protein n=1 Tax=Gigaspora rosea TaxID=44941 RepID=A0A397UKP0_9GLOM|nr:hypothetical protein C2G38_169858 [Gigaspora rosea]
MLALFNRVTRIGNQYPEMMKAQMFVQGLCPDLSLAVGPFMPNSLQEAIERARVCEITFTHGAAIYGPAAILNMISNPLSTFPNMSTVTYPMSQQVTTATSGNNSLEQIMMLLQEVVSVVKNNNNNNNSNNYTRLTIQRKEIDRKEIGSLRYVLHIKK